MAKVRSMPSSNPSNFNLNDASIKEFNREICEESPTEHGFSISSLLNDSKSNLLFDKNDLRKYRNNAYIIDTEVSCNALSEDKSMLFNAKTFNSDKEVDIQKLLQDTETCENPDYLIQEVNSDSMAPVVSRSEKLSICDISLSSLAENHFKTDKKTQAFKNSECFEIDFDLLDIPATTISYDASVNSSKVKFGDGTAIADVTGIIGDNLTNCDTGVNNDVDDFLVLLESYDVHNLQAASSTQATTDVSQILSNSHGTSDIIAECMSDSQKMNELQNYTLCASKSSSHLKDILFTEKHENVSYSENKILTTLNEHSPKKVCEEKNEVDDNGDSDNLFPDIDLTFCVKKHMKDKFPLESSSPESQDSGFDEVYFAPLKVTHSVENSTSCKNMLLSKMEILKPKLLNYKQSLLSKAISCKPKTDISKKERLNTIKSNLFNNFPSIYFGYDQQKETNISKNVID